VAAYSLEVTLLMHDLAVLICIAVSLQFNRLVADWAGIFFLTITVCLAHGGRPPLRGTLYHICALPHRCMSNRELGGLSRWSSG